MPVRKFRSADEMNQPVWREKGEPELYNSIRALFELGRRTSARRLTPGVRKFHSIEEMSRAREA